MLSIYSGFALGLRQQLYGKFILLAVLVRFGRNKILNDRFKSMQNLGFGYGMRRRGGEGGERTSSSSSAFKKFGPPPSPLETENASGSMIPNGRWKKGYIKKLRESKMKGIFDRTDTFSYLPLFPSSNPNNTGLSQAELQNNREDAWKWAAIIDELEDFEEAKDPSANEAFVSEFICWLLGKSRWNHPNITPWAYQRLVGDSIQEFIKEFVMKKTEYALELQKLKADPQPPNNIGDAWIYFKYLVTPLDLKAAEGGVNFNLKPPKDFSYDEGFLPDMEYWIRVRQDPEYARSVQQTRSNAADTLPQTAPRYYDRVEGGEQIAYKGPPTVYPYMTTSVKAQSGKDAHVPHGDRGIVCDENHPGGSLEARVLSAKDEQDLADKELQDKLQYEQQLKLEEQQGVGNVKAPEKTPQPLPIHTQGTIETFKLPPAQQQWLDLIFAKSKNTTHIDEYLKSEIKTLNGEQLANMVEAVERSPEGKKLADWLRKNPMDDLTTINQNDWVMQVFGSREEFLKFAARIRLELENFNAFKANQTATSGGTSTGKQFGPVERFRLNLLEVLNENLKITAVEEMKEEEPTPPPQVTTTRENKLKKPIGWEGIGVGKLIEINDQTSQIEHVERFYKYREQLIKVLDKEDLGMRHLKPETYVAKLAKVSPQLLYEYIVDYDFLPEAEKPHFAIDMRRIEETLDALATSKHMLGVTKKQIRNYLGWLNLRRYSRNDNTMTSSDFTFAIEYLRKLKKKYQNRNPPATKEELDTLDEWMYTLRESQVNKYAFRISS